MSLRSRDTYRRPVSSRGGRQGIATCRFTAALGLKGGVSCSQRPSVCTPLTRGVRADTALAGRGHAAGMGSTREIDTRGWERPFISAAGRVSENAGGSGCVRT